jgi:hypothetical protein
MSDSDIRADDREDIWSPEGTDPADADAPEADAVEQQQRVVDDEPDRSESVPDDVNPADAVEQGRPVGFDEDDYR